MTFEFKNCKQQNIFKASKTGKGQSYQISPKTFIGCNIWHNLSQDRECKHAYVMDAPA